MISRTFAVPALAVFAFIASIAGAQQPAATAMPAVPAPTCVKPQFPGPFDDSRRIERFNKEGKVYSDCIKKYVDETKALSDAVLEAGNKAIAEYNGFAAEVAERQAAVKK